ncbi:putative oxygen-independent coproporphyrinogen III oxidase [Pectobacterium atrosepticum SCRI1043]|uniref:Heme chaperone HemW n=1 Tax=Pectobacterium atrosepticum (strain SCRI 1043 / ATCC BAA-672) TaxID=218491 RepID=Q6D116_PECAS|nr:radical SAM family heme chaperone HemW [Pectobacterium atrosepticum]ATY92157.1 YggW family oxidoreductase [Pectobacterium atrosepticum]KFX24461.1 coproporphyrinogen III oxidase [Pectobacterium atrosepticum]MBL0893704.1 radical SAM family heme chaperone HemW [Pectobacterium atrosepticum]MCA6978172.1 radical SAM family heme chaperone HemW [Pectobacterium atrosepticum]MCH5019371.1 radical SAM family heme chaperone HemW [Pectobacterium atrosepticum]
MLKLPPLSLYIHIPWCVQKCPYCDFNSHALKGDVPHQEYVDHLLADLDADLPLAGGRALHSIFIGGGTPSLLSAEAMQALLDGVRARIPLTPDAEITMEANPGTVEADRFSGYQRAGINRISIGVQSFDPQKLTRLGRIHGPEEAKRAAQLATGLKLRSFNLDLMHGLPDQSLDEALDDLRQAIALNPPHLSWYQLTIEPNTLFSSRPPTLPDDDALWDIYEQGHALLSAAGYEQYETSAYAKPGYQCQHNLNYWRFGDYLGIGCGAHGKLTFSDGHILRTVKVRHPRGYMQGTYMDKQHDVANDDRPFEFFMNRFRLLEAAPRADFTAYTGLEEHSIRPQLDQALAQGYLTETATHWQITEHGKLFLNSLLELFLAEE